MKAIITKYHGPNRSGVSRISARAEGTPTRYYPFDDDARNPHLDAAEAYRNERGWTGAMAGGGLPDQTGYAWVFVGDDDNYIPVRS